MFSFKELIDAKGEALIMGILNITPDSFSDGGEAFSCQKVIDKVKMLCNDGADIIDVGACSTAPTNTIADETEEINRLQEFLPLVIQNATVPVSVDTFRPHVAELALRLGATIVNDESGAFCEDMARVVKQYSAGWIFMHTGGGDSSGKVEYSHGVVDSVLTFFENMKNKALEYGISETQLCYDCGIGFGKSRDDDLTLLSECDILSGFSPLLIGVSRKRIIGYLTGIDNPRERDYPGAVVGAITVSDGAQVIRTHNVGLTKQLFSIYNALDRGVH